MSASREAAARSIDYMGLTAGQKLTDIAIDTGLGAVPIAWYAMDAQRYLHEHRIEKLPVVNKQYELKGLITIKDIEKRIKYPNACKDGHGRLRVGAAVGVGQDTQERVTLLKKAGVDLVVIDTAHGHSEGVAKAVARIKKKSNSVAYHYVRERCALGMLYASYINTKQNLADSLTKCQTVKLRQELCSGFMRYVRKAVDVVASSLRPLLARVI